jgi:hypothetical protein
MLLQSEKLEKGMEKTEPMEDAKIIFDFLKI